MLSGFDEAVARELEKWLARPASGRRVAVFDADGTLWRGDVGEAFFQHQLERKSIPGAPKRDPWGHYFKEVVEGDTAKAYGWLAQWNAGVRETDLIRWCDEFFTRSWEQYVFEPMRALTHALLNADFEIWVVTASPRWSVQAGVKGFGVPADHVIGSSVSVGAGVLTGVLSNEVPYRAGKARLIKSVIGQAPAFVAGNTLWDREMMALATDLALAVHSEVKGEANYDSEQKLQKLATANGWLRQGFGGH